MTTTKSAVAQLDIGEPDDEIRAIIAQIDAYASRTATTEDDHVVLLRGTRLLRAYAYDAWLRVMARAYYFPGEHVSLTGIGELNGGEKPMARSTVQHHVEIGIGLLKGEEWQTAQAERARRREAGKRSQVA